MRLELGMPGFIPEKPGTFMYSYLEAVLGSLQDPVHWQLSFPPEA